MRGTATGAGAQVAERRPAVVGQERVVRRRADRLAGGQREPEDRRVPGGEDVGHVPAARSAATRRAPTPGRRAAVRQAARRWSISAPVSARRTRVSAVRQPDSRRSLICGLLVGALLGATVELRDRDDRHLELLGEQLERTGELRDLLLAGLDPLARAHQLEVVDDDELEVVALLEPAALGPDLHQRHVGRVVDEERRLGDAGPSSRPAGPVARRASCPCACAAAGCRASAESRRIVISVRLISSEKTTAAILCLIAAERDDVEADGRLAHRRPGGDDDHLAGVQAVGQGVEVGEARGHAGHLAASVPRRPRSRRRWPR